MKIQLSTLALATTILLTAATTQARPADDITLYIPSETLKLKYKPGAATATLQSTTLLTYYSASSEPSKAKAEGIISYYISTDGTLSIDDRFVTSKSIKLKDQKEKRIKVKFPILTEEAGKQIIAITDSPQDLNGSTYSSQYIPFL